MKGELELEGKRVFAVFIGLSGLIGLIFASILLPQTL